MGKHREPIVEYKHQVLMSEFNDLHARIKVHLFCLDNKKLIENHPKPSVEEMDLVLNKILTILKEDSRLMRT